MSPCCSPPAPRPPRGAPRRSHRGGAGSAAPARPRDARRDADERGGRGGRDPDADRPRRALAGRRVRGRRPLQRQPVRRPSRCGATCTPTTTLRASSGSRSAPPTTPADGLLGLLVRMGSFAEGRGDRAARPAYLPRGTRAHGWSTRERTAPGRRAPGCWTCSRWSRAPARGPSTRAGHRCDPGARAPFRTRRQNRRGRHAERGLLRHRRGQRYDGDLAGVSDARGRGGLRGGGRADEPAADQAAGRGRAGRGARDSATSPRGDGAARELDGLNREARPHRRVRGTGGDAPTELPKHDFTCTDASRS